MIKTVLIIGLGKLIGKNGVNINTILLLPILNYKLRLKMTTSVCITNYDISTAYKNFYMQFLSLSSTIRDNLNNKSFNDITINSINMSVGITPTDTPSLFPTSNFNNSNFTNFWNGNNNVFTVNIPDTNTALENIEDGIIELVNKPPEGLTREDLYVKFLNPYIEFIIEAFFCSSINLNFSNNINNTLYFQNLYKLIRGTNNTDDTGSRGAGTNLICKFCNEQFKKEINSNDDVFTSLQISSNEYYSKLCGCCYQLNDYYPSIYSSLNPSEKPSLICLPICNPPGIVKPYNGVSAAVNNGYPGNINTNSADSFSYTRRTCIGQTICVIDNISINIEGGNSQVEFNQICPGCNAGNCSCYIDFSNGGTLDSINNGSDGFQNNVTINNSCKNTFCNTSSFNNDNQKINYFVPCNPNNTSDTPKSNNSQYNHDGQPVSNSTINNNIKYIFGIQNWLIPALLFLILSIVIICLLIVNLGTLKREIYLLKN